MQLVRLPNARAPPRGVRVRLMGPTTSSTSSTWPAAAGTAYRWTPLPPGRQLATGILASITTADSAWSIRRRRSSSEDDNPFRSMGIRSSRSPAVVVSVCGRKPLRWAVRVSVR